MAQFLDPERRDFWAICEDRYGVRSTVLRSQLPVSPWHEQIGDSTLADAFSIAGSQHYRIEMSGGSMRNSRAFVVDQAPATGRKLGLPAPTILTVSQRTITPRSPRGVRRDLLDYCHRDALAMVRLVENLEGLARVAP